MPARIYRGVGRRLGKGGLETHAIEVLNEPFQILALQTLDGASKIAPLEAVAELFLKLWGSDIKVADLL